MEEIEKAFQARQRRLENEARLNRKQIKLSQREKERAAAEAKKRVLAKLGLGKGLPPPPKKPEKFAVKSYSPINKPKNDNSQQARPHQSNSVSRSGDYSNRNPDLSKSHIEELKNEKYEFVKKHKKAKIGYEGKSITEFRKDC